VYIGVLVLAGIATAIMTALVWRSGIRVQDAIRDDANARIEEAREQKPKRPERTPQMHILKRNVLRPNSLGERSRQMPLRGWKQA
jgi:hypothetical protein